jgi:predicted GNAT superfamily acetyltransferase
MSERMTEICCSNHYLQFAGKCSDVCVICDQRNRIAELEEIVTLTNDSHHDLSIRLETAVCKSLVLQANIAELEAQIEAFRNGFDTDWITQEQGK